MAEVSSYGEEGDVIASFEAYDSESACSIPPGDIGDIDVLDTQPAVDVLT